MGKIFQACMQKLNSAAQSAEKRTIMTQRLTQRINNEKMNIRFVKGVFK